MQSTPSNHKKVVQHEFTQQAQAYASNTSVLDPERLRQFVQAVRPSSEARVLDVATGPGYVAMAFAEVCREVIGVDLTPAPLTIAEATRQQRQLKNVRFQIGDAERLPFTDGAFDVVSCRLALHHVEDPQRVLAEMTMVCRVEGIVAIEDLVASEYPARQDELHDLSGTHPFRQDGKLFFLQRTAAFVGRKLPSVHS